MKVLSVIVLAVFVISCGAAADDSNQKEKRYIEEYEGNQHGLRQELPHPEYRHQQYRFNQQQVEKETRQYMVLMNEEEYQRYNQYHQSVWESQRVHNGYKHFNHNDNYQVDHVPEPHREVMKQILYQAVPYPVEVPQHAHRPQNHGKHSSEPAVEIQKSIPIYTEKQIHYQMKHPNHATPEQVAEKPFFREAKQENRFPQQRGAVHAERPYPVFMQYPILIVKNEQQQQQQQQKPAWH